MRTAPAATAASSSKVLGWNAFQHSVGGQGLSKTQIRNQSDTSGSTLLFDVEYSVALVLVERAVRCGCLAIALITLSGRELHVTGGGPGV